MGPTNIFHSKTNSHTKKWKESKKERKKKKINKYTNNKCYKRPDVVEIHDRKGHNTEEDVDVYICYCTDLIVITLKAAIMIFCTVHFSPVGGAFECSILTDNIN